MNMQKVHTRLINLRTAFKMGSHGLGMVQLDDIIDQIEEENGLKPLMPDDPNNVISIVERKVARIDCPKG